MTVGEIIASVDEIKVNAYEEERKVAWVARLLDTIDREVYATHEGHEITEGRPLWHKKKEKTAGTVTVDTVINIPDAYISMVEYWLWAQIDLANMDLERYNNSLVLFNNASSEYRKWYNRTHMPKGVR